MLLSGDREEARDIVQEVLTRALVKWHRITSVDEPYGYVRRMMTNEFLSLRRRRRLWTVPLGREALDGPGAPRAAAVAEPDDELRRLLGTLPRQQRAVIVLRYYEGLCDHEIAEALGCRTGTVCGYASRALATLRIELTEAPPVSSPVTVSNPVPGRGAPS